MKTTICGSTFARQPDGIYTYTIYTDREYGIWSWNRKRRAVNYKSCDGVKWFELSSSRPVKGRLLKQLQEYHHKYIQLDFSK